MPVLVGPKAKIDASAEAEGLDLGAYDCVYTQHSHEAAARAVSMMEAVVEYDGGLRTERRMSHMFAFDVPDHTRPLFITDAAINIYPTLEDKRNIAQNAIDFAHALGMEAPKVAILSAVET